MSILNRISKVPFLVEISSGILFQLIYSFLLVGSLSISNYSFERAVSIYEINRSLQPISMILILGYTIIILISLSFTLKKRRIKDGFYIDLLLKILIGVISIEYFLYTQINALLFRDGVLLYPSLLGLSLLFVVGLKLFLLTDYREDYNTFISRNRVSAFGINKSSIHFALRYLYFILLFYLIVSILSPVIVPSLGLSPHPVTSLNYGITGTPNRYQVEMTQIKQTVSKEYSNYIVPDNHDGNWYTYVFSPTVNSTTKQTKFPVVLFLHGYSGTSLKFYRELLTNLASSGAVVIFSQYMTYTTSNISYFNPKGINASTILEKQLYIRYNMEWKGITSALDQIQNQTLTSASFFKELSSSKVSLDLSRVLVMGHSMGGGMTPFIAYQTIKRGWANNQLLLDMEAPWLSSNVTSLKANFSQFPSTMKINIVGYQDDHTVSPCMGMNHYYNLIGGKVNVPDNNSYYLFLRSDRSGYPRQITSHYLPVDIVQNTITKMNIYRRTMSMVNYLAAEGNNLNSTQFLSQFLSLRAGFTGKWSNGRDITQGVLSRDPFGLSNPQNNLIPLLNPAQKYACP